MKDYRTRSHYFINHVALIYDRFAISGQWQRASLRSSAALRDMEKSRFVMTDLLCVCVCLDRVCVCVCLDQIWGVRVRVCSSFYS